MRQGVLMVRGTGGMESRRNEVIEYIDGPESQPLHTLGNGLAILHISADPAFRCIGYAAGLHAEDFEAHQCAIFKIDVELPAVFAAAAYNAG